MVYVWFVVLMLVFCGLLIVVLGLVSVCRFVLLFSGVGSCWVLITLMVV